MSTIEDKMENPTLSYVVIAVALAAGMLAASAVGQPPQQSSDPIAGRKASLHSGYSGRRWVLGVRADATDAGYLIRTVEHASAARHHGLEVGDRIIAVGGKQIGRVGHRVVRLGDQLELEGGQDGHVLLLIQNRRNHRLVPLGVTLRHPSEHLGH